MFVCFQKRSTEFTGQEQSDGKLRDRQHCRQEPSSTSMFFDVTIPKCKGSCMTWGIVIDRNDIDLLIDNLVYPLFVRYDNINERCLANCMYIFNFDILFSFFRERAERENRSRAVRIYEKIILHTIENRNAHVGAIDRYEISKRKRVQ